MSLLTDLAQSPQEALLRLLASGADDRTALDVGLRNKYGRSIFDDGLIRFGSCTSSTLSEAQWRFGVECLATLRARLAAGDALEAVEAEVYASLRTRLCELLRIPAERHRLIFTPSGTDAETVFLLLLAARFGPAITNVLVAPQEIGGGSVPAAAGRYFSHHTADGRTVKPGSLVAPQLESVEIETVEVRDADGGSRDIAEIDREVTARVVAANARGRHCIIHLVAHSKTGVHAPSLNCTETLGACFGAGLTVLVDGAQGRFSRAGMQRALEAGEAFMTTGSKFFGGPSFCGLIVLPNTLFPSDPGSVASGLAAYCNDRHLDLIGYRVGEPNPGLMLRWQIAMQAIERYYAVPGAFRYALLRRFEVAVPAIFADRSRFLIEKKSVPSFEGVRLLESTQTVFMLSVLRDGQTLSEASLERLLARLGRALTQAGGHSVEDFMALQCRFELGQPVVLRPGHNAVRIAIGGENISQLYDVWGDDDERAGEALERQLQALRRKIDLLVEERWDG